MGSACRNAGNVGFRGDMIESDRYRPGSSHSARRPRSLRRDARAAADLPHGHVEAKLLADNEPFPEPAALIITPDHYIVRML